MKKKIRDRLVGEILSIEEISFRIEELFRRFKENGRMQAIKNVSLNFLLEEDSHNDDG